MLARSLASRVLLLTGTDKIGNEFNPMNVISSELKECLALYLWKIYEKDTIVIIIDSQNYCLNGLLKTFRRFIYNQNNSQKRLIISWGS